MKIVPSKVYSQDYFETECGGWEDWHATHGKEVEPRVTYSLGLSSIEKGMKVLDFGSGRGELVYQTAQLGADAAGLDYSIDAIKLAKKLPYSKKGKMSFILFDGRKIPFKDKSVDRIFFLDVFEHIYPEQLELILAEFKRILKPKTGKIILHTAPNREFMEIGYPYFTRWISILINPLYERIFKEKLITRKDPRRPYDRIVHINESTLKECKIFFQKAGFDKINLWYSSDFRNIRKRDHLRYILLQPQFGFLKRWFCYDIWGVISYQ